jgi:hypothetical protein
MLVCIGGVQLCWVAIASGHNSVGSHYYLSIIGDEEKSLIMMLAARTAPTSSPPTPLELAPAELPFASAAQIFARFTNKKTFSSFIQTNLLNPKALQLQIRV